MDLNAGDGVPSGPRIEAICKLAVSVNEFGGKPGGLFELACFEKIRHGIHEVVDVIPIVVHVYILRLHVLLVGLGGGCKNLLRAGVIANSIEDMSRHVDHVAGSWSKFAKDFSAMERLVGMLVLDGMNPIVVRGGVIRIFL